MFQTVMSPVLEGLHESDRPAGACTTCEAAVWFTGDTGLKCHCRAMQAVTFDSEKSDIQQVLECSALLPLVNS